MVGDLAATGAELAAGVIYYGGPPKLDLVLKITLLEGHYASRDPADYRQDPRIRRGDEGGRQGVHLLRL